MKRAIKLKIVHYLQLVCMLVMPQVCQALEDYWTLLQTNTMLLVDLDGNTIILTAPSVLTQGGYTLEFPDVGSGTFTIAAQSADGSVNVQTVILTGSQVLVNYFDGENMYPFVLTPNNQNTFVGVDAGNQLLSGTQNTGFGAEALQNLLTGSRNTAVGCQAQQALVANSDNVAVGYYALKVNTNSGNTAVGSAAMAQATATYDVAVGHQALYDDNSQYNTAVGAYAMGISSPTKGHDVAVGSSALYKDVGPGFNTALGSLAMDAASPTGGNDVAIGYQALLTDAAGYNTAVGSQAGFNVTQGFYNTIIGYNAGNLIITSTNNIIIGAGAQSTNGKDVSGNIIIGNNSFTTQSNTLALGFMGPNGVSSMTSCFIDGIYGKSSTLAAIPMYIAANGQVGTAQSSAKYKRNIHAMDTVSEDIYKLRPVTFNYVHDGPDAPVAYGLIAEEVDKVYPDIVVKDKDGAPLTIQYQYLPIMMLHEQQKDHARLDKIEKNLQKVQFWWEFETGQADLTVPLSSTSTPTVQNTYVGSAPLTPAVGGGNVAVGANTLQNITSGYANTVIGALAGSNSITGTNNVYLGYAVTGTWDESGVIRIGTPGVQSAFYAGGISGLQAPGGSGVFINAAGQLGTSVSSRRYKDDIHDMADATSNLDKLRPVTFTYKADARKQRTYGLIAEEVQEYFNDMVTHDAEGHPESVQYHLLPVMLLNEWKKDRLRVTYLEDRIAQLEHQMQLVMKEGGHEKN